MPAQTTMPIKRGTIVEFIGAAHGNSSNWNEKQDLEFFDKYGIRVGDKGKIWEGYRGSWIRITWTRQDGTKAPCVPMRSGNFKVLNPDYDSDSVPELESNEVEPSATPAPQRNSPSETSSSVMFGFDSPQSVKRQPECDVRSKSFEHTLTNRCHKIQSLQRENAKLKKDNTWLNEHTDEILHQQAKSRMMMELKDKRNCELIDEVAELHEKLFELQCGVQQSNDYKSNFPTATEANAIYPTEYDAWGPNEPVDLPLEEQNWDDWALEIQSKLSANKLLTDVQQSILTNLAETMTGVKTRLEALESKDNAALCVQSVAKDYLINKREAAEWVVPEMVD